MGSPSPAVHLIPPLMGVAAYLTLHNLWIWQGRRAERLNLWVSLWCANSLVYLASHYAQVTATLPQTAVLGGRLAWTSALALILVTLGMSHALGGLAPPRRLLWGIAIVDAGLALVLWLTGAFVSDRAYVRTDLLGFQYMAPVPGPFLPVLVPYVLWVFVHAWRALGRGEMSRGERRAIRAGFVVYLALALNDLLHSARLIQSIRVFDVGFVAVGVGFTYMLVRRHNRLAAGLEAEVAVRTRDLETRRAELSALVETGQAVMGGLDLGSTLDRIVERARRITGSPHVKLLLVDREAGVLRMGALSGGSVPPGFQVPLGQSYSGTVAVTGEPLFISDTQRDPRNLLAERDREQGIVTYLGLPVKKGEEILGVLTINTEAPREYSAEELAYLGSFADQAAIAIDNAGLYSAAEERGKRLATLAALTKGLVATRPLDDLLHEVVRSASALFAPSAARIWLMDEAGETISLRARAGDVSEVVGATRLQVGQGMIGRIAASGAPLVIEDLESHADRVNVERHRAEGLVSFAGVPLLAGDRRLGALGIASRRRRRFGAEDMSLLQALADHAATAIDGARLFAAARDLTEEIRALHDTGTALTSTLDLASVLDSITASAIALTGAHGASVFELSPGEDLLHLRSSRGIDPNLTPQVLRLGQGAAGAASARRETVWSDDILARPLAGYENEAPGRGKTLGELTTERGYRALLAVPLVSRDTVFGAICLYWYEPHAPGEREIRLLGAFARHAAVALEHARLHASLRRRVERLETLTRISRTLLSSLDLDGVLNEIARSAAELMGVPVASFWRVDEGSRTTRLVGFSDPTLEADWAARALPFDQGVIGWVATHRRSLHVPDGVESGRFVDPDWWRAHRLTSFYGIPVMHEDSLVAVLALNGREPFRFDAEDEALLSAFVAQAAVAIHNASLYASQGRQLDRVRALARINRVLSSTLDRSRVLDEIARAAAKLADARFVSIWLADEATQTLTMGSASDPGINADWEKTTLPFGTSGVGWVAAHRRTLRVDDTYADDRFVDPDWRRRHGLKAFLGIPVMYEGGLAGVLSLGGPEPVSREPEDEALLSAFAAQAAVAIHNASLFEAEGEARRGAELALAQVRQLQGLLPICAYCKKIRDDSNYWQTVESYIGQRSAATFSHGICPDCKEKIVKPEMERFRREQRGEP